MKPGSFRRFALAAGILSIALWLAPALLVRPLAVRLAGAAGVALELDGVRPALPWGVVIRRAVVTRDGFEVELGPIRAQLLPTGGRAEARVGAGSLLLRTEGLGLRSGVLRAQALPLDRFERFAPQGFALRGTADGVYHFGTREELELTLSRGAVVLRAPMVFDLEFAQLVVAAAREPGGGWRVDFADLRGPPLSGSARGRIRADGRIALTLEITQLEEPARSAFDMAALPTGPIPYQAELGGTLEAPVFSAVSR